MFRSLNESPTGVELRPFPAWDYPFLRMRTRVKCFRTSSKQTCYSNDCAIIAIRVDESENEAIRNINEQHC